MSSASSDNDDIQGVIIDNGSYKLQAGFAGDDAPRCLINSVAGHSRGDAVCYGNEAIAKGSAVELRCPMQRGVVTDWNDMEQIWDHVFKRELRVSSEEYSVLLTEPPLNPKYNREKMAEIMFESFRVPSLLVCNPAVLSLYASGRTTGLVFCFGEEVSYAVPLSDFTVSSFCCHDRSIERQNIGGKDVTNYLLTKLVTKRGMGSLLFHTAREIKERHCYVAGDLQKEMESFSGSTQPPKSFTLPDGRAISLGKELFSVPEALFRPHHSPLPLTYGVHEMINRAITRHTVESSGEELSKQFYSNIVLSGGSTMLRGFTDRIMRELSSMAPAGVTVKVIALPGRKSSAWIGGSIVTSIDLYKRVATQRKEYLELGASAIHRNT